MTTMLSRNGRLPPIYVLLALALCTLFFYYRSSIGISPTLGVSGDLAGAANATLGFGGLYVVSGPGSPRRQHLEQAAAVTELRLTIPEQVAWSDGDIKDFRWPNETESRIGTGSAKAWLSHHLVLKAFLDSGLETALIFEDDVDWDIRLRTQQIPRAQKAAQSLTSTSSSWGKQYPWGRPSEWDLFYLGHCGDYFNDLNDHIGVGHHHPSDLEETPHVVFEDPSMPYRTDIHPFTASLFTALGVPEQHRLLHASKWPLCTFGYAVTRTATQKILSDVAPQKEDIARNLVAYDAALLSGCRDKNKPWSIRCYTVQPEFFHHMEGKSIIALQEETKDHHVFRPPVDVAGLEQVEYRHETSNIGCGFWSGEFYYLDEKELNYLRREVGRKGRCLKKGRDA